MQRYVSAHMLRHFRLISDVTGIPQPSHAVTENDLSFLLIVGDVLVANGARAGLFFLDLLLIDVTFCPLI